MDFFHSKIPSFSSTILRDFNLGRTLTFKKCIECSLNILEVLEH